MGVRTGFTAEPSLPLLSNVPGAGTNAGPQKESAGEIAQEIVLFERTRYARKVMSVRGTFFPPLALVIGLSPALYAQDSELPTPEEYAERAEVAENAPLFQSEEPLKTTLLTDIKWLRDKRIDTMEVNGILTFAGVDGAQIEQAIEVRTRGIFRRNKRNCNFPPLRFNFPKREMEGTVFEGQDKLKLVTPCHDGRDNYQRYVYREYLAYKAYQLLTPVSFRVRLVEITYEDINDKYDTRTKIGFLIESDENMAERNRAVHTEYHGRFHPAWVDGDAAVRVAMFNYMIGNTDWSAVAGHNTKLIKTEEAKYLTVPYDFDFSGAVNARYASPDPSLTERYRLRRVTDRHFRGFCRPELVQPTLAATLNEQRDALWDLYMSFDLLEEKRRKDAVKYYEDFYKTLNDERDFKRKMLDVCRALPG